jgi:hypothetical protein
VIERPGWKDTTPIRLTTSKQRIDSGPALGQPMTKTRRKAPAGLIFSRRLKGNVLVLKMFGRWPVRLRTARKIGVRWTRRRGF